ncbi:hypothetical protein ACMBCM_10260 [Spiroplasma sp. K1]
MKGKLDIFLWSLAPWYIYIYIYIYIPYLVSANKSHVYLPW